MTLLLACLLAAGIFGVLRMRRTHLEQQLQRQGREVAVALAAVLEPVWDAPTTLGERVAAFNKQKGPFRLEAVSWPGKRPSNWWAPLVDQAARHDTPSGRWFGAPERSAVFAMAVPLHNASPGTPGREISAYLGLVCDGGFIDGEVAAMGRRIIPFALVALVLCGLGIYGLLMSSVVRPLRRLVGEIDAVAHGDLSPAVLPDRDDEIGLLAGRFNAMTNSLRDAREEQTRANTARLALEARLRHSEKLAVMGQMAAEIAHEVGTPLGVIGGRSQSLAKRPADAEEVVKNADIITAQVDRIAKIIRQVLAVSRQSSPALTQVDVSQVVNEALAFVAEDAARQRIAMTLYAPPSLSLIPGDPGEVQQVVLNLLLNAIAAMPAGGQLTVTIEQVSRRKEGLELAAPSGYLMLAVSDTGTGVDPDNLERVFEPFFTTKAKGEGTGLGLAVAKGIVRDHDGWMEVDNVPGGGAIFRVFLPLESARIS
jgi:signal transduction histidine kinase